MVEKRDRDSEAFSVWKKLCSNLAANLLPFSHINLKEKTGHGGLEIDRHVIIGCGFPQKISGRLV